MKKMLSGILLSLAVSVLLSCASTSGFSGKDPVYDLEGGKYLDSLWEGYYKTRDESYIEKIMAYANTEDLLMVKINENYEQVSKDNRYMSILEYWFNAEDDGEKITSPADVECLVSILLADEAAKNDIRYLYSIFDYDLFLRGVMKSTALWSLSCQDDDEANIVIQKNIPYMREKFAWDLYAMFDYPQPFPFVKDENGYAVIKDDKLALIIAMVNDSPDLDEDWIFTNEDGIVNLSVTNNISKSKDSRVTFFISANVYGDLETPVYYDFEMMGPSKELKKNIELIPAELKTETLIVPDDLLSVEFEKSDPLGEYTFRFTIHTKSRVLSVAELKLNLNK